MPNYWTLRIAEQNQKLYDMELLQYRKMIKTAYQQSMESVKAEMLSLYLDIENGKASLNDLYSYGRYTKLYNSLGKIIADNGKDEYRMLDSVLTDMYGKVQKNIAELSPLEVPITSKKQIEEIIKQAWTTDGKSFSDRIWLNKAELQNRLTKGLVDCVATGASKDKLVKNITDNIGVGFSQSDRLVRTELTRSMNQSAADSYMAAGCKQYEFLATEDERTCDVCGKMNGKRFKFTDMEVGVNFPPLHCNDRCTIIPVID